jgi:hypothetical protein
MVWTIEDPSQLLRVVQNRHIQNDSIFGKLVGLKYPDHPGKRETYFRYKGKESLNYLHLGTNEKQYLADSTVLEIPLSAVSSVTKHKNQHPVLIAVSTIAIILSIIAKQTLNDGQK